MTPLDEETKIIHRLPPLSHTPEGLIKVLCHGQIRVSAIGEGTLELPDWMVDKILSWTGLLRWQLIENDSLESNEWRPRLWLTSFNPKEDS